MSHTSDKLREIGVMWKAADVEDRICICMGLLGLLMMAISIIHAFGWAGLVFLIGFVLNFGSKPKNRGR
jgi:low temperature requirement protein LtrA